MPPTDEGKKVTKCHTQSTLAQCLGSLQPLDKNFYMMTHSNSTRVRAPKFSAAPVSPVYDGATPNPPGRVGPDSCGVTGTTPFIRRCNLFQLSTLNTRTLNPLSRKQELASSAFLHHNDIICIQEHRQYHAESLKIETVDSYHLITSSATKNSVNASVGGVGSLKLSPSAVILFCPQN